MKATDRDYFVSVSQRGFTLVEMIVVIVITGIVAAAVAVFIRAPVQGYVDLVARAELADEADTAVRRISREVRRALPNSVRLTSAGGNNYLEFLLTSTGGRYLTDSDDIAFEGNVLSFTTNDTSFRVVDGFSEERIPYGSNGESWVVIYNLGPGQEPANAYCSGDTCNNRALVSAVDTASKTITMASNPFAAPGTLRSPGNRFQVVTTPVTYECNPSAHTLTRYSGYTIGTTQPAPPTGGTAALLASGVTSCNFSYDNSAINTSQALLGITLAMARPGTNSGTITLFHQVHVDNTP
ncbi:prepilin-type N-terminal cleavage/methylation domain-containing protein [Oxalicibacterium solurbis]|uniref:MSHA biogenesis protein MshO n=1 Tax=Oxalicibacterium solurbis TaxID=69280 RepID=A0A8J3B121_9BURK|nr:prepilin-type N-terminal cleavage/methylation domain-containing protein [Oxalicibacterium solurbis]GGI53093.1 MSHA biogenesis protein MshO [Oxalicibacterium solurbis]